MNIHPIAGALGAVISGVDLSLGMSTALAADIRQVFLQHKVIFLRQQKLTPQQFLDFAKAMGLELDLADKGMGVRCKRMAMVIENGVVSFMAIEPPGGIVESSAEAILKVL